MTIKRNILWRILGMDFEILNTISEVVKAEIDEYSKKLSEELLQKYMEEFESKVRSKRREVVLKICDGIQTNVEYNQSNMAYNFTIKLENK